MDFPGGSEVKNLPVNTGDVSSIFDLGKCPGVGNGNPLQYSCLGYSMDRGGWGGYCPRDHNKSDKVE